ncbi:MAG: Crp/Fnr family transcriptional regulator [Sphingomicrobium sp.]
MNQSNEQSSETGPLERLVRKLQYWEPLSSQDCEAIRALPHTIKKLEPSHYIVRECDRAETSCLIVSGFAMRHKIVAGGQRQIVAIHMAGDLVDLQSSFLRTADHSVQMLTRGTVALFPRAEIQKIAFEHPSVGKAMWIDSLVDASIHREWIANVGRRDARTRIAHLFCEFALRLQVAGLGEQTGYEMPLTQEQLADATGLTPVHVNRSIKSLEADHLIGRSTPRSITISDWRKLADFGDFNSSYLHLQDGEPALAH